MASERAQQDLIVKYFGEFIDHVIEQSCKDDECKTEMQTFRAIEGILRSVEEKRKDIFIELGHKVCQVAVEGKVEKAVTTTTFKVFGDFSYKNNQKFNYNLVVNKSGGDFFIYNLYKDRYKKVYSLENVADTNEIRIPLKTSFKAVLPDGKSESHEMVMFLYVFDQPKLKDEYSVNEMNLMVASLDPNKRKMYRRYVTVTK